MFCARHCLRKYNTENQVCKDMWMKEESTTSHPYTASIFSSSMMPTLPLSPSGYRATPHHAQMHAHMQVWLHECAGSNQYEVGLC